MNHSGVSPVRKKNCKSKLPDRFNCFLSQSGISLIEVLMAALILSFGVLLVLEGMGSSRQTMKAGSNLVWASLAAEEQLSLLELEARQKHALSGATHPGSGQWGGETFSWKTLVQPFHHASISDESKLNRVTVDMKWKDSSRRQGSLILDTLIMNREEKAK